MWFFDHINHKIIKGKFDKYMPYNREYSETVRIKNNRYSIEMSDEILESWTFSKRSSANKCLKAYLKRKIRQKKSELSSLNNRMKELK